MYKECGVQLLHNTLVSTRVALILFKVSGNLVHSVSIDTMPQLLFGLAVR